MTNDCVDPKVPYFFQDAITNSETAIKSCFSPNCCDEIRKTEEMLPSNAQINDTESGGWIADHEGNQAIDQASKSMLLLKLCFVLWLSIESRENTQWLHKNVTGISTGLGYGVLEIELSSDDNNCVENYIEAYSFLIS